MLESNIDINKVFKEGFDIALIDSGISALSNQRFCRLISQTDAEVDIHNLRPPADTLINEIESHLMGALKLFAERPGVIKKRISVFRIAPDENLKLEGLQWLQPSLGVILLMPESREIAVKAYKNNFSKSDTLREQIEVAAISSHPKKITAIVFNPSSMLFSWKAPRNKAENDQILITVLFGEIEHV